MEKIPFTQLFTYSRYTMASTTEAHSVSAKSTSDITADDRSKSGYYGVNSGPGDGKNDAKVWSTQQNDE